MILENSKFGNSKARYSLLKHTENLSNPNEHHFDLLLEDGLFCRTWRLEHIPEVHGPETSAVAIKPHQLRWLEPISSSVSGGRGWATWVGGGYYNGILPKEYEYPIKIRIINGKLRGLLIITSEKCFLTQA